jgi:signal transduction histidine kinase
LLNALRTTWTRLRNTLAHEASSLRGRLLYALLGLMIVLLAVNAQEHFARLNTRRAALATSHQVVAAGAAGSVRLALEELYRRQQLIATAVLSGGAMPYAGALLQSLREGAPDIASIQVLATDGRVLFSSPPVAPGSSAAGELFFKEISPTAPRYLSNVYAVSSPAPGAVRAQRVVRVASVISDATRQPRAIVTSEAYAAAVWKAPVTEAPGAILVLDGSGQAVATSRTLLPAVLADAGLVGAARDHRQRPVELRLEPGPSLSGYVVPVEGTTWSAAYLSPESMAPVSRDTQISLLLMLAVVSTLAIAILVVLQLSLRPLVRLSAATRKLGSGDLSFRVPSAEIQEFEPLVEAFNRMAESLETAQEQLREVNRDLEMRVRQRTRQLEEEHEKVLRAERLSTLGLFSSAIAHDLRSPLNTLTLISHWLKMHLRESRDEQVVGRLEVMNRELRRADLIIRTLLAFARTGELHREPVDANGVVLEVLDVVGPSEAVRVRVDLTPDAPRIPADRAQLFQVIENLTRNAVQAMPEGGGLSLSSSVSPECWILQISDTGPGIPPELQASVFEPLVTTKATGTGLGLALCKRIVDAHGGALILESRPREGTTFRMELPLHVPEAQPPSPPASALPPAADRAPADEEDDPATRPAGALSHHP